MSEKPTFTHVAKGLFSLPVSGGTIYRCGTNIVFAPYSPQQFGLGMQQPACRYPQQQTYYGGLQ